MGTRVDLAMFEILAGFGETEKGIDLATSLGTPIKNLVELDLPPSFVAIRYQDFLKSYGQQWVPRKPVTGRYNCAGHVWASRRTTILEVAEYHKIIREDGYRRISQDEWVMPDDIAVYEDGDQPCEIMHVARVYKLEPGLTPKTPIPWL